MHRVDVVTKMILLYSIRVQYRSGGIRSNTPEDGPASRFEKVPLKGPPVKNLHDEPLAYSTSTPVLPSQSYTTFVLIALEVILF